jgi:hypothetical protein
VDGLPIAQVPVEHRSDPSRLVDPPEPEEVPADAVTRRLIQIRAADSFGQRSSASILIHRMYSGRGYRTTPLPEEQLPSRLTLVASDRSETVGTITIGFDMDDGEPLHCEDLFAEEVGRLRAQGHRLCEFTKLAMDHVLDAKPVLASLFHVAYLYAFRALGYDRLLIEVNPRHVRWYVRMLGFKVHGPQRLNLRVHAPAVLLMLDFGHSREQIDLLAGHPELGPSQRTLYPYFFSAHEEAGILARLRRSLPTAPFPCLPEPTA